RGAPTDDIAVDIAIGRHVREVAARLQAPDCCHASELQPGSWDLLWLLQSDAERRIDKTLQAAAHVQGLPMNAIEALNRYEPFYDGHPTFTVTAAEAA